MVLLRKTLSWYVKYFCQVILKCIHAVQSYGSDKKNPNAQMLFGCYHSPLLICTQLVTGQTDGWCDFNMPGRTQSGTAILVTVAFTWYWHGFYMPGYISGKNEGNQLKLQGNKVKWLTKARNSVLNFHYACFLAWVHLPSPFFLYNEIVLLSSNWGCFIIQGHFLL